MDQEDDSDNLILEVEVKPGKTIILDLQEELRVNNIDTDVLKHAARYGYIAAAWVLARRRAREAKTKFRRTLGDAVARLGEGTDDKPAIVKAKAQRDEQVQSAEDAYQDAESDAELLGVVKEAMEVRKDLMRTFSANNRGGWAPSNSNLDDLKQRALDAINESRKGRKDR